MKKIISFIFLFLVFTHLFSQQKITVAVAANTQYAMKEIEKQYEKETGKDIELIIGSSGKLTAQIMEGAPFDIFLSADMEYPKELYKEGLTTAAPKIYGYGSLVLWTLKDFAPLTINTLLLPDLQHIAIGNPKTAPYGVAAIEAMKYYKLYENVEPKLVYGESISQVNQYIISMSVDIGFTAKSVVVSPEMQGKGKWVEVDEKVYQPIAQGAVLLKISKDKADAEQFYNYLYSEQAQRILKNYGYKMLR